MWRVRIQKLRSALGATSTELTTIISRVTAAAPSTYADHEYQLIQLNTIESLIQTMNTFWQQVETTAIDGMDQLHTHHIMPPVHRIRQAIRQFTLDYEIIERAINQRSWFTQSNANNDINAQARSLMITDKLTLMAIAPLQHLISNAPTIIPVTYFTQCISIRQVPYNDRFILVGLTFDLMLPDQQSATHNSAYPAFELMAIPHEVGHFVYHYATDSHATNTDKQSPFATISDEFLNHPLHHWCEELFADTYGSIVAGACTAFAMQALLATEDPERLLLDDEEHPTPLLRPYLLSEMLYILHQKQPERYPFADLATLLDANWTAILTRFGFAPEGLQNGRPNRVTVPSMGDAHLEEVVNVRQIVTLARPIIERYAAVILAAIPAEISDASSDQSSTTIPWSSQCSSLSELVQIIKDLAQKTVNTPMPTSSNTSSQSESKTSTITSPSSVLIYPEKYATTMLVDTLGGWNDSGPTGSGGH